MKHAGEIISATSHCVWCPTLCLHACPVVTAEGSDVVSPWGKMSLARWLAEERTPLDAAAAAVLYKCTGCGACQAACRHGVDVGETLRLARQDAVATGITPHAASMFSVPVEAASAAVIPAGASGFGLWAAGYRGRFEVVAGAAAGRWGGRQELVFESAEDVACVEGVYPEVGLRIDAPIVLQSERRPTNGMSVLDGPVAYHEACHIARGEPERARVVRERARQAAGGTLLELRWTGETATCCGAGGAYRATSPDGAHTAGGRILDNALLKGARTLVTGCAGCASHLREALGGRTLDIVHLK